MRDYVPILNDRGTMLRRWRADDAIRLRALYDAEVLRWGLAPRDRGVEALRTLITGVADRERALGTRLRLAICHPRGDQVAGALDLIADRSDPRAVEVAFLLGPAARGRGIATAAVGLACGWALGQGGFDRIRIRAHPGNVQSHAVARRAGFHQLATRAPGTPRTVQRVTFVRERG